MTLTIGAELALLALQIERAESEPDEAERREQRVLARLDFEALWCRYRSLTQSDYDACRVDAADSFELQMAQDIGEAPVPRLVAVKGAKA